MNGIPLSLAIFALLSLAWLGLGGGILRLLRRPAPALTEAGLAGLAGWVVLGGVLNAAGWISPGVCRALTSAAALGGLAVLAMAWRSRRPMAGRPAAGTVVLGITVAALLVLHVGGYLWSPAFNAHDDFHAYLAFPQKMLATGSLGVEPFSERRMAGGLGGHSFLQALALAWVPAESIHLVEPALPYLFLVLFLGGCAHRQGWPPAAVLALAGLALVTTIPRVNTTSLVGSVALFAYAAALLVEERPAVRTSVLLALILAALAALKTTNLLPVLALVAARAGRDFLADRRTALPRVLAFGALLILFLLPWMWQSRQGSGTWLFPLLGAGWHSSAYAAGHGAGGGAAPATLLFHALKLATVPAAAALALLAGWAWLGGDRPHTVPAVAWFALALLAAGAANVAAAGGYGPNRYTFAACFGGLLGLLPAAVAGMRDAAVRPRWRHTAVPVGLVLAALPALGMSFRKPIQWREMAGGWAALLRQEPLDPAVRRRQYAQLLDAVPAGEAVLVRLDRPYLLDFARHRVWLADAPGKAGPPPGFPRPLTPAALEAYLLQSGVSHLAYSYGNQANYGDFFRGYSTSPHAMLRQQAETTFAFQDAADELGRLRPRVADDGTNFVIRLGPAPVPAAP